MLTIYKASAGSGKTFTLAYEYVKLLLGVKVGGDSKYRLNSKKYLGHKPLTARHRHILAITFTNKATEEMKSRIIKELSLLASDDNASSGYADMLIGEFGCSLDELRAAASTALRSLLFDYHHFNVSTIDSFFQTVLRAFAREVDRQGDYGIEISDDFAVASGISMMLDDLNYGNPPRAKDILRWIRNYTMELIEEGKDSGIFNRSGSILRRLSKYVKRMSSEAFKKKADLVIDYLNDPGRMEGFVKALADRKKDIIAAQRAGALDIIEAFRGLGYPREVLSSIFWEIVDAAADGKTVKLERFEKAGVTKILNWQDSGDPKAVYTKKYCPTVNKNPVYPPDSFTDQISRWLHSQLRALPEIESLEAVRNGCTGLQFLGFTWEYIRRFREENNLILLSDTQDLIHRIIAGSDAPFIYERIGVTLSHFLIDEFQDTSVLQWSNLKPLVANSISTGNDNLIIGDEKQAIYRFRNSDSSLLHHVVANDDFPNDHLIRGVCPEENTNHRSARGIVMFNNALFPRLAERLNVAAYDNAIQEIWDKNTDLSSHIKIYDTGKMTIDDYPAEYQITAREILRQHDAGYRWGDIAVLVRTGKQLRLIVDYLLKRHPEINVVSAEGLLLKNSPAIKLIIGMLKLVDKSYSASSQLVEEVAANAPTYGTNGDIRLMISRYDYFRSNGYEPAEALRKALQNQTEETADIEKSIIEVRSSHPTGLLSLIEIIIEKLIIPERRVSECAYIAAFQDEVIKYTKSFNPSIHAFLEWWDEMSDSLAITPGEGQDAVNIMTIHAVKGLEKSCVIIPFGDIELCKHDESLWVGPENFDFVDPSLRPPLISVNVNAVCERDGSIIRSEVNKNLNEQIADNLNTIYVAYTRATRELTICFSSRKNVGKELFDVLSRRPSDFKLQDPERCMDLQTYMRAEPDEQGVIFEYGEPTVPVDENKPTAGKPLDNYNVYYGKYKASFTKVEDMTADLGEIMDDVSPADDASADSIQNSYFNQSRARAAERGTQLHSIMADIDAETDIDAAVDRAAVRYGLGDDDRQAVSDIIASAFRSASDYTRRWFSSDATVYKEQSIFRPYDERTFRPDRIVVAPDGTVDVVDYKFAAEPSIAHSLQVENYMTLLRAMGYQTVRGYLWYPDLNIVESVN